MSSKEFYLISQKTKERFRVQEGETTIGRGPFLKVKDKRVSRSHAIISFNNGCLKIKPIHTNPTFFWPDTGNYVILEQDVWKSLNNDDMISLLPDDLLFSVDVGHSDDLEINQEEFASSKDQNSETRQNDKMLESKTVEVKEPLHCVLKSDKSEDCKIDEPVVQAHEGTFEDSIDSLGDVECDFKVQTNLDKDTKMEQSCEDENNVRKINEEEPKTNQSKSEPPIVFAKDADNSSWKEKKRVLPSWMMETSSPRSVSKGRKTTAKSSTEGASKRKINHEELAINETKKNLEKNRQYERGKSSTSKRMRQEETLLDRVNDDYSSGRKSEGLDVESKAPKCEGSKNGQAKEKDVLLEGKQPNEHDKLPCSPKSETKKLERTLSDGNEKVEVGKSPESCESENLKSKGRADDEASKLAVYGEMDAINRANEEGPLSKSVTQGDICAKGDSVGKAETVKKKLPKCEYGKSCYRKNPVHFQEYSHSDIESDEEGTSELSADSRSECPYGTSCYRQNPQHKLEYKHTKPPSVQQRSTRKTMRKSSRLRNHPKKSVLSGESDDDGEDNDYDYDDSFIDDGDFGSESSSSYQDDDDDDDDWSPEDLEKD